MRFEFKISVVVFCLAFCLLFFIHLVALPFYWVNISQSQHGRPFDLYSPDVWTPAITFHSILATVFVVLAYELYSSLRKRVADEGTIFITMLCLGFIGFWLGGALGALRYGHTMRLPTHLWSASKTGIVFTTAAFLVSLITAVGSVAVYEIHKLIRWVRKRLT